MTSEDALAAKHSNPTILGYETEVRSITPTYENAAKRFPYDGGNALGDRDDVDETGTVVLSEFDIELRLDDGDSRTGPSDWTAHYEVDVESGIVDLASLTRHDWGSGDADDTLGVRSLSAAAARAHQAAVEFVDSGSKEDLDVKPLSAYASDAMHEDYSESRFVHVADLRAHADAGDE